MISISTKGDGNVTRKFLERLKKQDMFTQLDTYGREGVQILRSATPVESRLTADSWEYRVIRSHRWPGIEWYNTNPAGNSDVSVAVLIQYGHATGGGGYVHGRDYINPAMRPFFDRVSDEVWKKVKS